MAKEEVKVDEIEAIGKDLPKSKATKDFIKKVQGQSEKKKTKAPAKKSKKTASGVKIKGLDEPPILTTVPPPKTLRVTIPAGEIVYLYPDQLDNFQHQPRDMHKKIPQVDPVFTKELETAGGNLQAILAQRVKRGAKPIVIDGHRRVWSLNEINKKRKKDKWLKVKVELVDVNDAEAAVIAYRLNITAERLTESERDHWVYTMMVAYGMTSAQIQKATGLAKSTVDNIRRVFAKAPASVLEAIEDGTITTGHAKAIVSLPPKAQKSLVKAAVKMHARESPMSVREMESQAAEARSKEQVVELIADRLESKHVKGKKTPVYVDVDDPEKWRVDLFHEVFPAGTGAKFGLFGVRTQEVKRGMRRAGVRLRQKPQVPVEEPKVELCLGCVAYVKNHKMCLWTALNPEIKPPQYADCPKYLAGKEVSHYTVATCPYCNVPIWDTRLSGEYPSAGAIVVHEENGYSNAFVDPNLKVRHVAHAWCFIQEFITTNRLEGVCSGCSSDVCALVGALSRMRSLKDHHTVEKCPLMRSGFDLEKLNKIVLEDWTAAQKRQKAELEAEEKLKRIAEKEKAKAEEEAKLKKDADAKGKAKTEKQRARVTVAKAKSKASKEVPTES